MEETKTIQLSSIGQLCDSGKSEFVDKDSLLFKDTFSQYFIGPINQMVFPFIVEVKTYLKSQILSARKEVRKLFKKVKSFVKRKVDKIKSALSITVVQLSLTF